MRLVSQVLFAKWSFRGSVIDLPMVKLIFDVILLQSLAPRVLIRVLNDGNHTVLPVWDPMVGFYFPSKHSRVVFPNTALV